MIVSHGGKNGWKTLGISVLCILLAGTYVFGKSGVSPLTSAEKDLASQVNRMHRRAAEQVIPSVVSLTVSKDMPPIFPFGDEQHAEGIGSGCIIDKRGYVITNNHVVADTSKVTIILADGRQFEAVETMTDPDTDLAVVKFDPKGEDLPAAVFGDSEQLQVGDVVMAIGSPFGLTQTVTSGIVSYKGRQTGILGPKWGYEDFIQTDADINKGNSGGPLINLYGEIIGINSNIFTPTGVSAGYGFAVPSNIAKFVVEQLIEHKVVKRGWLGITMQDLDSLRKVPEEVRKKMLEKTPDLLNDIPESLKGVLIIDVNPGSPAEKAGLKPKDVILSINGQKTVESNRLKNYIATIPPDHTANCEIWRQGKTMEIPVTLGDRSVAKAEYEKTHPEQPFMVREAPPQSEPSAEKPRLGVQVKPLDSEAAKRYNYDPGTKGLLIENVQPGSLAEQSGLKPGDVIVQIGGKPVDTFDQLKEAVEAADFDKDGLQLQILDSQGTRMVFVKRGAI